MSYKSAGMVQPPVVQLSPGSFPQNGSEDLSTCLLTEGQGASAQLSQVLTSILNNQQLLLASYHASLTAGLPSLSSQEVATPLTTLEKVTKSPTSNVSAAKAIHAIRPEEETSVINEASLSDTAVRDICGNSRANSDDSSMVTEVSAFKDNGREEIEDGPCTDDEPRDVANQNIGGINYREKILVSESSTSSTESTSTNEQTDLPEKTSADEQADPAQENQSKGVPQQVQPTASDVLTKCAPIRVQTPNASQLLNLSAKDCSFKANQKPTSVVSQKCHTDENKLLEREQPLDLRVVKDGESTSKSKEPTEMSECGKLEEEEPSTRKAAEDEKTEKDSEVETMGDSRKVIVRTETDEYVPVYVPTPVSELRSKYVRNNEGKLEQTERDEAGEENVLGEILQEEDMTLTSPLKRRARPEVGTTNKKRKTEEKATELQVDVAELSERTLVTVVDTFRKAMQQNVAELKEMRKAMVDSTVVMSKLVDGLARHMSALDTREKEEQRREERRIDLERRREEERRKEGKRQKEDDRRREDWRREMDQKEREINRRERELDRRERECHRRRDERHEESSKSRSKENEPSLKSVLGESKRQWRIQGQTMVADALMKRRQDKNKKEKY